MTGKRGTAPGARLALVVAAAVGGVLILARGLGAFVAWRETTLATSPPPNASRDAPFRASLPLQPLTVPSALESAGRSTAPPLDTDGDGLLDDQEILYRTSPDARDTDRDGYDDGVEVAAGHDPTRPGPDDRVAAPSPEPGETRSYTERFRAYTGLTGDTAALLRSDDLGSFVADENARGFLPTVRDEELAVVPGAGKSAAVRYLDAVSVPQNARLTPISSAEITAAFRKLTAEGDARPLEEIRDKIARNAAELERAPVPQEALPLHRQFVAATRALHENAEKLLAYRADPVGSLVAASRIENLRGVFRSVAEGLKELEKKYGIT